MKIWLSRAALVTLLVTSTLAPLAARQATAPGQAPAAPLALTDKIPLDPTVHTGRLPNGLTYFVRRNARPANRVSLRLAVKAGSLDEADDQQGLAHMLEHMAFNGSTNFKPGDLISTFEAAGARLGPHVNAYTSFEETVYMLDLPSDKPDLVGKGFTAFADFAGGLTLDPKQIDKERGVVTEEWRGGLGAQSRVRDKQIPVLFYQSRFAERLPIGKPDIIRTFPPARLRAFYDSYYRPERMAVVAVGDMDPQTLESDIKTAFSGASDRSPAPPPRNVTVPLHKETLVSVVTDPEITRSSVSLLRKRPKDPTGTVGDYRRDLVQQLFEQMLNARFEEIGRRPDAKYLGAGVSSEGLSSDVVAESLSASVQDGKILDGLASVALEAKRAREFGFAASELDREKKRMDAGYERAYMERDKSESGSFAQEYLSLFLEGDPSPGIEYEHRLVQQFLPGITAQETAAVSRMLMAADARVVLATAPEKAGAPPEEDIRKTLAGVESTDVTPWNDTTATRELIEHKPEPAAVVSTKTVEEVGLTIVRFANGVEAWLKPTDFKNDQVVFAMQAKGGVSLSPPEDFYNASLASAYIGISGAAGLKAIDIQKMLAGKIAGASPFASLSTHGFTGFAAPAQLETALQLLYARFTAPGDDPEAFELLKKQLSAAVANRTNNPDTVFADKVEEVNTSNHYTSRPLTPDGVNMLDRSKMMSFYRGRFSNAADFTFFMVGAFKIDEALPLLQRYVGGLPSTGTATSEFKDVRIQFPARDERATVQKGREPKSETVISYYAEPPGNDPLEMERVLAATDVLELALRDILREELGQTYTVSVGLSQSLPQKGDGHVEITFGASPENMPKMIERVQQEVDRLRKEGPSVDLLNKVKETAKRNYETSLKTNGYWLGRFQAVKMWNQDPAIISHRVERIDALTPASVKESFNKYFPAERITVVTLMPAIP
ncbi:MAG TPA: insulinase family protein [Vicinamibacterales bacterium]